jgi:hypothetical protein
MNSELEKEIVEEEKPAWRIKFGQDFRGGKEWFWFAEAINANFTVPDRAAGELRPTITSDGFYKTKELARKAFMRNKHLYTEIKNFVIHL